MAIIKGPFEITGSIKGVSFYKQAGSDKVIMRTKGGPTKEKIAKSPKFEKLRLNQQEWGGCVKMTAALRRAVFATSALSDFNVSAAFNGLNKEVQKCDKERPLGNRAIELTLRKYVLDGYSFNRKNSFNSLLRVYISHTICREELRATFQIPYIHGETHLNNYYNHPYFRIVLMLGSVSDMVHTEEANGYIPLCHELHGNGKISYTEWFSTGGVVESRVAEVAIDEYYRQFLTDDVTLIASIGIEFGKAAFTTEPQPVKHSGAAMILTTV